MSERKQGGCLCGNVRYEVTVPEPHYNMCHCDMCRRWGSGPWIGASAQALEYEQQQTLGTIQSSAWAERAFCKKCGSSLFYRVTAEGKYQGLTSVAVGALDDQTGITITRETFIDKKPECYALEGDRERVTEAQVFAMFGGG